MGFFKITFNLHLPTSIGNQTNPTLRHCRKVRNRLIWHVRITLIFESWFLQFFFCFPNKRIKKEQKKIKETVSNQMLGLHFISYETERVLSYSILDLWTHFLQKYTLRTLWLMTKMKLTKRQQIFCNSKLC